VKKWLLELQLLVLHWLFDSGRRLYIIYPFLLEGDSIASSRASLEFRCCNVINSRKRIKINGDYAWTAMACACGQANAQSRTTELFQLVVFIDEIAEGAYDFCCVRPDLLA